MSANTSSRTLVLVILELIVGGIVVLGGAALVYFSVDATSKALGIIHATLGLIGFSAGFLLWVKSSKAWTVVISANALIIAFSTASEVILSVSNSLPSGQFVDSIIGTIAAVLIAAIVIVMLAKQDLKKLLRKGDSQRLSGIS
ncbi:MAG TPA: hypothetical protein VE955_03755 [Candidatus Dormibacteraeota bacterium]|jgi:peptidoglycan/LPS O-acetylase OafA/YrhL|nr:hypothetical protein [Candidatus Dormibacteraeota bacterium]